MMSLAVSFCAVLFPRDVLDEIWDLIESVSEGFPTYSVACPKLTEEYQIHYILIVREYNL